jgi:hypothetical protein
MRKIEFVSYDGKYPNLCSGTLTIKVDGKKMSDHCLRSGGSVWFDKDWSEHVEDGPWGVTFEGLTKEENDVLTELVNDNVRRGCCGGCV